MLVLLLLPSDAGVFPASRGCLWSISSVQLRGYAIWNVMVTVVVLSTAWPLRVAGRKRICCATRLASSSRPWPRPCTTPSTITWPLAVNVTRNITSPCTLSCLASLVYSGIGFETTTTSVGGGPVMLGAAATAVGVVGMPAEATFPTFPDGAETVAAGTTAAATFPPGLPLLLPYFSPSPMPVEPTTP